MIAPYIEGIEKATEEGAIRYYPIAERKTFGPYDSFCHLPEKQKNGDFVYENTRSLEAIGKYCIELYREKTLHMLLLGPGGGKELADACAIHSDIHIDTVSSTPIHPHLHVLMRAPHMRKAIEKICAWADKDEYQRLGKQHVDLTPDYVLQMQEKLGLTLLQSNAQQPVAEVQHIGLLKDSMDAIERAKYDLVYEHLGPLYYSVDSTYTSKNSEAKKEAIARRTIRSLKTTGMLVIGNASQSVRPYIEKAASPEDLIIHVYANGASILAKPESPIAIRLEEIKYETRSGVLLITEENESFLHRLGISMY